MLPDRSGAADALVRAGRREHRQRLNQLAPRDAATLEPLDEITDELHVSHP